MCGLCRDLGAVDHWAEPGPDDGPVDAATRRAERRERVRAADRLLGTVGLAVGDWQGRGYVVDDRRGRRAVARDLGEVWAVAAAWLGRPVDPMDPSVLERLAEDP